MRKELKAQIIEKVAAQLAENPNFYLADIAGQAAGDAPTQRNQAIGAQASSAPTQAAKRFAIVSEIQLFQTECGPDGFYICVIAAEPL